MHLKYNVSLPIVFFLSFFIFIVPTLQTSYAQINGGTITYGTTVGGIFTEQSSSLQRWTLTVEERDHFEVNLRRIGGRFIPELTVIAPDGSILEPDEVTEPTLSGTMQKFTQNAAGGVYTIEVIGEIASNSTLNPNEYSLTVTKPGSGKASTDEGLTPLPTIGLQPSSNIVNGSAVTDSNLNVQIYNGIVERPNEREEPNRYVVSGAGLSINVNNANPVDRGVIAFGFDSGTAGFVASNEIQSIFATNRDIDAFEVAQGIYSITLSGGQTIVTDFYRVQRMEVIDGLLAMQMTTGQRILLSGLEFDIRRRGGINGEGPSAEPINEFRLQNDDYIFTDLSGFDTLAYLNNGNTNQLRVLYGDNTRFISDTIRVELLQRGNSQQPELNDATLDTSFFDVLLEKSDNSILNLEFQLNGLGDIQVENQSLSIRPLDGRTITEEINGINRTLIEDAGIRMERLDGTYLLSLPGDVVINTPAEITTVPTALPGQPGFTPRMFNNPGFHVLDYHPTITIPEALQPVNRINGNFYYPVQESVIPSHTHQLEWTRHYNSMSSTDQVPGYLRSAPGNYLYGSMGNNWRHTYQYDLDLTYAPLGNVRLILPDGSNHIFQNIDTTPATFRSRSLLSWRIQRTGGLTGDWVATTTEGMFYRFNRAGVLQEIGNTNGDSLVFSPAPHSLVEQVGAAGGFFVVEPYGRRFEFYTDENGQIILFRDSQKRDITYRYNGANLSGATYIDSSQGAIYEYTDGRLTSINDTFSPYHQTINLTYDVIGRVVNYIENPVMLAGDGALSRASAFDYTREPFIVRETTTVNNETRFRTWEHNDRFQLLRHNTPVEGWIFRYEYDPQSGQLSEIVQPDLTKIGFVVNEFGYITQLLDPNYRGITNYRFAYSSPDGFRQLLSQIAYPQESGRQPTDTFLYDNNANLIERTRTIQQVGQDFINQTTRYSYDDFSRIASITDVTRSADTRPNIATEYSYDDYGYVTRIAEGTPDTQEQRVYQFAHDSAGRLLSTTDGRGIQTVIRWNDERDLVTQLQVAGTSAMTEYTYDTRNRVTRIADRGTTDDFVYNSLNQVTSKTDGIGQITTYTYDEADNLISITLPGSAASTFTYAYDALNRLTSETTPDGLVTTYDTSIAPDGSLTRYSVTDPQGDTIVYTYDAGDRLQSVGKTTRSGNPVFQYNLRYNPQNNLVAVQEAHVPGGRTLSLTYDLAGKPLESTINGFTTAYSYDTNDYLESVITPEGRIYAYERDIFGNITQVTLPNGSVQRYQYDENGNLTGFTDSTDQTDDSSGRTTLYTYDELNRVAAELLPDNNRFDYGYDERSNLVSITDPRGNATIATYDPVNRLIRLQEPGDVITDYAYDEQGRLTQFQTGRNNRRFTYDEEGNVVAVTLPTNGEILYSYDVLGRVTSVTNSLGHSTLYNYDSNNRITRIIDPLGIATNFNWGGGGRLNSITTDSGKRYTYLYDSLGRVSRIADESAERGGFDTLLEYTDDGFISEIEMVTDTTINTDRTTIHTYTYDLNGQLTAYTPPESTASIQPEYDEAGQITSVLDVRGIRTNYIYDNRGNITQVVRAAGTPQEITERYDYDANGNITQHTAPDESITIFEYDERNLLIRLIESAGTNATQEQRFSYDEQENLISWIDSAGNETQYIYGTSGRLELVTRQLLLPDGTRQPVSYVYEYDDAGNLNQVILPEGNRINLTYNSVGNRVRYVDARANSWAYTYDTDSNLSQITDPLGSNTTYLYDLADRIVGIEYPTGAVAGVQYDTTNNPGERLTTTPINANREREEILYSLDHNGNLVEITENSEGSIAFERDNAGNVIQRTDANGDSTRYIYDPLGRLTQITGNLTAPTINTTYDAAGRITSISNSQGNQIDYDYHTAGDLISMTDGDLRIEYTYDNAGNVLTRDAGDYGITTYTYDNLYRPVRIEKDGTGINVTYNANGWITAIDRDNGVTTTYFYDANGRVTQLAHSGADGTIIDQFTYAYDAVGNITRVRRGDGWTVIYSYDASHQLITERWLNPQNETVYSLNIEYDLAGNRISSIIRRELTTPERVSYVYNEQNQLIQEIRGTDTRIEASAAIGIISMVLAAFSLPPVLRRRSHLFSIITPLLFITISGSIALQQGTPTITIDYTYDANGNMIAASFPGGQLDYTYDIHNRLTDVNGTNLEGESIGVTFAYDVYSRLAEVTYDGDINERYRLLYDGEILIGLRNETTDYTETYFAPLGENLRTDSGGDVSAWALHDSRGTLRKLVGADGLPLNNTASGLNFNSFGQVITPYGERQAYRFDATGQVIPGTANTDAAFRLPVQPVRLQRDGIYISAIDQSIIGLRTYSPVTGRFLQRDPVRHDPRGTLYTYAYNNPNSFSDPDGLTPRPAVSGLNTINLPAEITPNVAPPPILPENPAPAAVQILQQDELHRPLRLMLTIRYDINTINGVLSESLCDFHIHRINPIEDFNRHVLRQPFEEIVHTYSRENGWIPASAPDPRMQPEAFAYLDETLPLLETAQTNARLWQNTDCNRYLPMPADPTPAALTTRHIQHEAVLNVLEEVPLYISLENQLDIHTDHRQIVTPDIPVPQLSSMSITPAIDFPRPDFYGDLHENTLNFYQETLLPEHPQPELHAGQSTSQSLDIAEPINLQIP